MPDPDTVIADGFLALRDHYADPGLPPPSVRDDVGRRRRRGHALSIAAAAFAVTLVAVVVPLALLAGRGSSHPTATATQPPPSPSPTPTGTVRPGGLHALLHLPHGRITEPVSIDHGQLRIDPEPVDYTPGVPASLARQVVTRTRDYASAIVGPAYGRVTISSDLTDGLPAYESRPAWVTVLRSSPYSGLCPALQHTAPHGTPPTVTLILTDADTGRSSIEYESSGIGACGNYLRNPSAWIAQETIGLRWTLLGQRPDPTQAGYVDWHISYRVPACALTRASPGLTSTRSGQPMLYVETQLPIDRPANCRSTRQTTWFGPESQPANTLRHALTGRHYY